MVEKTCPICVYKKSVNLTLFIEVQLVQNKFDLETYDWPAIPVTFYLKLETKQIIYTTQIDYEKYYAVLPMEEFNGIFLAF